MRKEKIRIFKFFIEKCGQVELLGGGDLISKSGRSWHRRPGCGQNSEKRIHVKFSRSPTNPQTFLMYMTEIPYLVVVDGSGGGGAKLNLLNHDPRAQQKRQEKNEKKQTKRVKGKKSPPFAQRTRRVGYLDSRKKRTPRRIFAFSTARESESPKHSLSLVAWIGSWFDGFLVSF